MRIKKAIITIFLMILSFAGISQSMQMNNLQACTGDTVNVNISMSNLDSIGAITLYIAYDTTKLKFINLVNINSLATGTMFNNMHSGSQLIGKIAISWVTTSGSVNFPQGIFGVLKFKVIGGSSGLQFLSSCEIAKYSSDIITVNYTNGNINIPQDPIVTIQPALNIINFQNANISLSTQNAVTKIWQKKSGNNWVDIQNSNDFQGVNSDTLIINHLNTITTLTNFRCKLSNSCKNIYSDSISVISNGIHTEKLNNIEVFPNPFTDYIYVNQLYTSKISKIRILQIDGKIIKEIDNLNKFNTLYINNLNNLSKGFYFIEIDFMTSDNIKDKQVYKLLKN